MEYDYEIIYRIKRKGSLIVENAGSVPEAKECAKKALRVASVVPEDEKAVEFQGEKVDDFNIISVKRIRD